MYKKQKTDPIFGDLNSVVRLADMASIPFDPANTDYQAYLKWLSDGNTPLPSEEGNGNTQNS